MPLFFTVGTLQAIKSKNLSLKPALKKHLPPPSRVYFLLEKFSEATIMIRYLIVLLITTLMSGYAGFGKANYHGSQAYN